MVSELELKLKRGFRQFLTTPSQTDVSASGAVRSGIHEVLERIVDRRWRAYVIGGTLRDVMLAPGSVWPRDIDVVVDGCSTEELDKTFGDLLVRRTRFGGLHLAKSIKCGGISQVCYQALFDIWRLEDTWGIRTRGLQPTIENFVRTPFLNVDSVAIDLVPKNSRHRHIYESGFFQSLITKTLEINFEPNPFPLVCIVRALIMAAKLEFALGRSLAQFVANYSRWGSINDLVKAQVSHYGRVRCNADELRLWLEAIEVKLHNGAERIDIDVDERRQLSLWRDWPPQSSGRPTDAVVGNEMQGTKVN